MTPQFAHSASCSDGALRAEISALSSQHLMLRETNHSLVHICLNIEKSSKKLFND